MSLRNFYISFATVLLIAGANMSFADSSDTSQQPGKAGKLPNLVSACSKECPDAKSNDEASKCVDDMETSQGESAFKKEHKTCFNAHEKYEKITKKQEAGEAAKSPDQADQTSSDQSSSSSY